jgi:hypothetical protein
VLASWEVNAEGQSPDALGFLLFYFPFRRTRSSRSWRERCRVHLAMAFGLC